MIADSYRVIIQLYYKWRVWMLNKVVIGTLVLTAVFVIGFIAVISMRESPSAETDTTSTVDNALPQNEQSTPETKENYSEIDSFEECKEAGYVIPSFAPPEMCELPDGRRFTGPE